MSEAYEIGIELAEQEALSGSLEIILQGFANLDAATAASNVGIRALRAEAGMTTTAETPHRIAAGAAPEVQAARGTTVSSVEASGANTFGSSDGETAAALTTSRLGEPSKADVGPSVAPGAAFGEQSTVRQEVATSGFYVPRAMSAGPSGRGIVFAPVAASAVAAVVPAASDPGTSHGERTVSIGGAPSPAGWGERPGVTSVTVETGLAGDAVSPLGGDRQREVSRVEAGAPRVDVAFRAPEMLADWSSHAAAPVVDEVSRGPAGAVLSRGEGRRPLRDRSDAPVWEQGGRRSFEATMAPSTTRGQGSGEPGGKFSERAAAPQGSSGGREEEGRAVVMLDGRLVGEMLSGRMARDAARPGAGTTSFDARQAPAWTPSGAL